MKRIIALMLALLIVLPLLPALAEDDYTLVDKFYKQAIESSAYRGTVAFTATGEETGAFSEELWAAIRALAPRLTLTLEHTTAPKKPEGQATVTIAVSGEASYKTAFLYDEKLVGVTSDFLSPGAYYVADKNWNWGRLFSLGGQSADSQWPPVWQMMLAVLNAPEEWKARAREKLSIYETKLGIWMNGYAAVSMGREGNTTYSELSCSIPAQAMKAEMKQLLVDFYNDSELLSMLREVVTAQEAAAYLQPGVMDTLFSMLDQLAMDGTVEVARRHSASGEALLDSITFPLAKNAFFTSLTLSMSPAENGQEWRVNGGLNGGADFDARLVLGEAGVYTGSVDIALPAQEDGATFVVSDEAGPKDTYGFDFSLSWDPGQESYSLADDRSTQKMSGSLLLRPRGNKNQMPEQSVTVEATLSSSSKKNAVTQLNGSLTWRDMETDASITAALTSRTVVPFAYETPSTVTGATRMELLPQESVSLLVQQWLARLVQVGMSLGLVQLP